MNIAEIEQEIVNRITREIASGNLVSSNIKVQIFPDDLRSFFAKQSRGAILVQYRAGNFVPPQALNRVSQSGEFQFSVFVIHKNIHDHSGAYASLRVVREALLGFEISGASKMYLRSERFVNEQSGLWIYESIWSVQIRIFENQ